MPSRSESIAIAHPQSVSDSPPDALHRLRNMWQFANLCQWIYMFGKAAKIDESIEIEDLEMECLKTSSTILTDLALALLKIVSQHRGLTLDILDDQLRKQYLYYLPDNNPLGSVEEETAQSFADLDAFQKIIILQQLTQWAMAYPERLRDKMEEQKDQEQATWRIEPYGWDGEDRTYFVLDDNRVYRLSEAPEPPKPIKPIKKRKSYSSGRRSSKRRRTIDADDEHEVDDDPDAGDHGGVVPEETTDMSLGGMKWECLAITLADVQGLINGFRKTRDGNEKVLRQQLEDHLLPILEKQEESRKRKEIQRERELLNLAKMATAKRSSRLATKAEVKKQEEHDREEEEKHRLDALVRQKEEQEQRKLEKQRDERLFARERRLKERETRRKQHQEELAQLSEDASLPIDGNVRMSERRLHAEIARNKEALEQLDQEEEDWTFDCVCGLYGQVDDGAHSVACERCNIWQHSKCIGITETEAEDTAFHFICANCKRRLETPRKTIKIKVRSSASKDDHTPASTTISPESKRAPVELMSPSIKLAAAPNPVQSPTPSQHTSATISVPQLNEPPPTHYTQAVAQPSQATEQPQIQTPFKQTVLIDKSHDESTRANASEAGTTTTASREPNTTTATNMVSASAPAPSQEQDHTSLPQDTTRNVSLIQPVAVSNVMCQAQNVSTSQAAGNVPAPAATAPVALQTNNGTMVPMTSLDTPKSSPPPLPLAAKQPSPLSINVLPKYTGVPAVEAQIPEHKQENTLPPIPANHSMTGASQP